MLFDLFNNPANDETNSSCKVYSNSNVARPPSKRKDVNLCGIINQGATCYLNTLIQTLYFTTEFREKLFSLTREELGLVQNQNGQTTKQRIILIELQRLFAQLMLLDQDSCSTSRLTESFGWNGNEHFQQHDVQELNRILFSAIEQSLVNTKQSKLIDTLYHGTYVNKIKCLTCSNIVQREEEFLDLSITIQGSSHIHESLINQFTMREQLTGSNQYRCEKCDNQYRDAEKYCQLKSLPPILTLSLLRFAYDLKTYQRYKETGRFEFPLDLDLADYMEDSIKTRLDADYTKYELFSVIIHSGSAHGGHYHAYIKDTDNLGNWLTDQKQVPSNTPQTGTEIRLVYVDDDTTPVRDANSSQPLDLDYLKYDKPLELLKAFIYNFYKYEEAKVEAICSDLNKHTGMSWNKRFKIKYGPIEKFLRKHDDVFSLSGDNRYVKLKQHDRVSVVSSRDDTDTGCSSPTLIQTCLNEIASHEAGPADDGPGERWYDFDDSRIGQISSTAIEKQFAGNESAYMLFYRRKTSRSTERPVGAPEWLAAEIRDENEKLQAKRDEYENSLNQIRVEFYLDADFYVEKCVLNMSSDEGKLLVPVDRRKTTVADVKELLVSVCTTDPVPNEPVALQRRKEQCLNILFDDERAFNLLLVSRVDTSNSGRYSYYARKVLDNQSDENLYRLMSQSRHESVLVLGRSGLQWPVGDEYEPVRLVFKFFDKKFEIKEISYTFAKSTPIARVKEEVSAYLIGEQLNADLGAELTSDETKLIVSDSFTYNLVKTKESLVRTSEVKILLDPAEYDAKTLAQLDVRNGDVITIESNDNIERLFESQLLVGSPVVRRPNELALHDLAPMPEHKVHELSVVNLLRDVDQLLAVDLKTHKMQVDQNETIRNIRIMALSFYNFDQTLNESATDIYNESHMRYLKKEEADDLALKFNLEKKLTKTIDAAKVSNLQNTLGDSLYDDITLKELLDTFCPTKCSEGGGSSINFILLLCAGRAPLKSHDEMTIKCVYNRPDEAKIYGELIVNTDQFTVRQLTDGLVHKLNLKPIEESQEIYYLKLTDWLGDVVSILNDFDSPCCKYELVHNQLLVVDRGKLIPLNHCKITLWLQGNTNTSTEEFVLNDFIETTFKNFTPLAEYILPNETKLEELTGLVEQQFGDAFKCVRLRVLKNLNDDERIYVNTCGRGEVRFQMKKALIDVYKTFRQLQLAQETNLAVQLLPEDNDSVNQGIVLLNCVRFNPATRCCMAGSYRELAWNVNNGATYNSLKESVYKAYADELEPSQLYRISIAKRLVDRYQWIVLKDLSLTGASATTKKASKAKKNSQSSTTAAKSNLKQAPFNLTDGDFIAFAVDDEAKQLTGDDFRSHEDLEYAKKLNITAAELSRIRGEKKKQKSGNENNSHRRPEVGIHIKIDDFS